MGAAHAEWLPHPQARILHRCIQLLCIASASTAGMECWLPIAQLFCAVVDECWVDVDSTAPLAFVGWGYKCPACCYLTGRMMPSPAPSNQSYKGTDGWLHTCVGVAVQTAILVSCPRLRRAECEVG